MKYCVLLMLAMINLVHAQTGDLPVCVIPRDSIVKHKISVMASEDKVYRFGLVRKKISYKIIHMFDTSGRIVKQEWISFKTGKTDHVNTYTYNEHGDLTSRKMNGKNIHMKFSYFYRYNEQGLMDQYYTEPRQKLLFRYTYDGLLQTKLKVSPTDTSEWWNYEYIDNRLVREIYQTKGIQHPFVTDYVYDGNRLKSKIHMMKTDTLNTVVYGYDEWGNKSSEVQTHRMANHRKQWIYKGNLLITYTNTTDKENEQFSYVYNQEGVLIQIKHKDGFGSVTKSTLFYKYR